jgi:hypothetical protein
MKKYTATLITLSLITFMSCSDSSTESSNPESSLSEQIEIIDTEADSRRSELVNSSSRVGKAYASLRKDVSNLKKDLSELKKKKQTKRVKEKIEVLTEKIYDKRQDYIAIEQNDIKADEIPAAKRDEYSDLLFELVKINRQKKSYDHRDDKRAKQVRNGLAEKTKEVNEKINALLK